MPNKDLICDYSDTNYEKDFWQSSVNRSYEDKSEKFLLKRLLPKNKESIIDVGAGFGRLTYVYKDLFKNVFLLDFANNLLEQAKQKFLDEENIKYINASCYEIPIDQLDIAIAFRLMHHIADTDLFFKEINRILKNNGTFILEFANKRNFLEIIRFLLGKSVKKPFSLEPYQYSGKVYYNFHPKYIKDKLKQAGFKIKKVYSVSNFRSSFFKKILSNTLLAFLDNLLSRLLGFFCFGPSIVIVAKKK